MKPSEPLPKNSKHVCHIVTSLKGGGVTSMINRLVENFSHLPIDTSIVCMVEAPRNLALMQAHGVQVFDLGLKEGQLSPFSLFKTAKILQKLKPDVVQGWMYHANVLAALIPGRWRLLWNIRHSLHDLRHEKALTRALIRLGPVLARRTDEIVFCSKISALQHEKIGFPASKTKIIPNGFATHKYFKDIQAGEELRNRLQLPIDAFVVGNAARFHPMKNHLSLIEAFFYFKRDFQNAYLVLCGRGIDANNQSLMKSIGSFELTESVRLISHFDDMRALYSALNILAVPSGWGEAFPNVLAEAMLAQVPCVTTNVGDSAEIVGDTGIVVSTCKAESFAAGMLTFATMSASERDLLGRQARARIKRMFSIEKVSAQYAHLYCR